MSVTKQLLDKHREALLDLSPRNRLMSLPLDNPDKSFLTFHGIDENFLFSQLVGQSGSAHFVAVRGGGTAEVFYPRPRSKEACFVETSFAADTLHKKLKSLQSKARESIEEKGVNTLHLSLGICTWIEPKKRKEHSAPILLVPVKLVKDRGLKKPFRMEWTEEDVELNPCLEVVARRDWGVALPDFDMDTLSPADYLKRVGKALKRGAGINLEIGTAGLGLFDFTKLSIYRDLDVQRWPSEDSLLDGTLGSLITGTVPSGCEESPISEGLSAEMSQGSRRSDHIADADESQSEVIELVREGKQVVVQGPPGTGKSQTITNIIATAVLDGKTVLFVCEKSAALEVVRDRLGAVGLGSVLLELHSEKATKKAVLSNLQNSWETGVSNRHKRRCSTCVSPDDLASQLDALASALHAPVANSGLSPYQLAENLAEIEGQYEITTRFEISDLAEWDASRLGIAQNTVRQLATCFNRIVDPSHNPWSDSVRISRVSPGDSRRLEHGLDSVAAQVFSLRHTATALAEKLGFSTPPDAATIKQLAAIAEVVATAPDAVISCSFDDDISTERLQHVVESAVASGEERRELLRIFGREALENMPAHELDALRRSGSLLGIFDIRCWLAKIGLRRTAARSLHRQANSEDLPEQVVRFWDLREDIMRITPKGAAYFGAAWMGIDSDWPELSRVLAWRKDLADLGVNVEIARQLTSIENKKALAVEAEAVRALLRGLETSLDSISDQLGMPRLHPGSFAITPLEDLTALLSNWRDNLASFPAWIEWRFSCKEAENAGMGDVVLQLQRGTVCAVSAEATLRFSHYRALLDLAEEDRAPLAGFRAEKHEALIEAFRDADRKAVENAKERVLDAYLSRLSDRQAETPGSRVLREEFNRKARHRPIRILLEQAGGIIQRIKPVFMMSPLSVAKYLSPGGLTFDLLVIDEASQIPPVEAFGAIARTRQHAVVGDEKQLPPSSFFARMLADEDQDADTFDEDATVNQPVEMESILSLCAARSFHPAMLRWHFRSQHESLIQFSNRSFYNTVLLVPPSPDRDPARKGLSFVHVPEGIYDNRCNSNEGRTIANAVAAHAAAFPGLSLGVVTFSQKQKEIVEEFIDELAERNESLADFLADHAQGQTPFFVKNLENVQGDERDVILISFCYGRSPNGKFEQHFGPLNKPGGERRLNVIATRAKVRCVLYASIRCRDFPSEKVPHGTPRRHLMDFMQFAEQCSADRKEAFAEPSVGGDAGYIVKRIAGLLAEAGYTCRPLGESSGWKIDLAVVDPEDSSRLILAILTDDLSYGLLTQARDRDRLFAQVLENVGWKKIVRIWTLDWRHDPDGQMNRILELLEDDGRAGTRIGAAPGDSTLSGTEAYIEAVQPDAPRLFDKLTPNDLADEIHRILEVESPIRPKLLNERLKGFFRIARLEESVKRQITHAIEILKADGRCINLEECLSVPGAAMRLRDRSSLNQKTAADLIPEAEIRLAAERVLSKIYSSGEDAVAIAAGLLGYQRPSEALKDRLRRAFKAIKRERQRLPIRA